MIENTCDVCEEESPHRKVAREYVANFEAFKKKAVDELTRMLDDIAPEIKIKCTCKKVEMPVWVTIDGNMHNMYNIESVIEDRDMPAVKQALTIVFKSGRKERFTFFDYYECERVKNEIKKFTIVKWQ